MVKIYENISIIIKNKGLTKKEFAQKLISLQPNVNRISETPTISTIYGYLNGRISIPIDLIPYIAEVLDVTEQEIFDNSSKTRKRCFRYFLQNATKDELESFNHFIASQIHNNININYGKIIISSNNIDEKLEKFIKLLQYAPSYFIDKVINRLEEYKKLDDSMDII